MNPSFFPPSTPEKQDFFHPSPFLSFFSLSLRTGPHPSLAPAPFFPYRDFPGPDFSFLERFDSFPLKGYSNPAAVPHGEDGGKSDDPSGSLFFPPSPGKRRNSAEFRPFPVFLFFFSAKGYPLSECLFGNSSPQKVEEKTSSGADAGSLRRLEWNPA